MKIRTRLAHGIIIGAMIGSMSIVGTVLAEPDASKTETKSSTTKLISVHIEHEDEGDANVRIKFGDSVYKFQLPELSEGEERTLATDDGKTVKVKRQANEVTVYAGTETIQLPSEHSGMHTRFLMAPIPPVPPVPPVPGVAAKAPLPPMPPMPPMPPEHMAEFRDSVVISGIPLTAAQQKAVTDALKAAGVSKPIKFVQHGVMILGQHGDKNSMHTMIVNDEDGDTDQVREIQIVKKTDAAKAEK